MERTLALPLLAVFVFAAHADSLCDDFLAALHKKPKDLEFLGCRQRTDLQNSPSEASYRVEGRHAAEVESYLTKELKIKRLERTCCVWESTQNSYRDRHDRLFVISMTTDETTVGSREQWKQIPYFYVKVYRYRDAP